MTSLVFGIVAALCWGFSDYGGALASRRIGVVRVSFGLQLVGAIALAVALGVLGRWPAFDRSLLVSGVALGVLSMVSLALLYRAMALGPISVVSPVTASYLALTVVLLVLFLGETLSVTRALLIMVVFAGVALTSTDVAALTHSLGRSLHGLRVAFLATLGFGLWGALVTAAVRVHDPLAVVFVGRVAGAIVLCGALLVLRLRSATSDREWRAQRTGWRVVALVLLVGLLDVGAVVSYALGVESGAASIVATAAGAYPLVPALLAITVLGERLAPNQYVGILVLVAGLVGLGLAG